MKITKTIAGVLGFAIALSLVVVATTAPAKADTISDLQAQIASLTAQLSKLAGSSAVTTSATFNTNLTVGSKGADVTALQTWLIAKGYTIAAGATGNFGPQTKAALAAYQAASGITPAAGYFGPITRAKVNGSSSVVVTPVGGTTTPVVSVGVTPSANEGIMTISAGPISNSVLNVGQQKAPVLTVRVQEQNSDIAIKRIQVDLGTNTTIYNKIFQNLYVIDASTGSVIATTPLNSSTVIQSGSDYITNIAIPDFVVKAGTQHDLTIAADVYSSVDSTYRTGHTYTVSVQGSGVRGTDGSGTDQYGPTGAIVGPTLTLNQSLVDNAQANVSLDSSSPLANQVPVTDTTNGQYLQLPVLVFGVNAQNDAIHLHDVVATITAVQNGGSAGLVTAAYLYQGSTAVASAAVSGGVAHFVNITDGTNGATIPVNSTLPYTIKVDVTNVLVGNVVVTASVNANNINFYNSQDETVTSGNASGAATGNAQTVVAKGAQFSLTSSNLTKSVGGTDTSGNSTTTYSGTFNLSVTAQGSDLTFGLVGTTTPSFGTTTSNVAIYKNGVSIGSPAASYGLNVNYSAPTNATLVSGGFTISRGNTVSIPVTYTFQVANPGTNTYALQLEGVNVVSSLGGQLVNFMQDLPSWRTNVQ
jgi:hypothetical protein